MSNNRLIYEPCALGTQTKQSTDPLSYITNVAAYEHGSRCGSKLDFGSRANIESELRGQTRPTTKCPCEKYNPTKTKYQVNDSNYTPPDACNVTFGNMPENDHLQRLPSSNGIDSVPKNSCK